jgi:hypothetical protein
MIARCRKARAQSLPNVLETGGSCELEVEVGLAPWAGWEATTLQTMGTNAHCHSGGSLKGVAQFWDAAVNGSLALETVRKRSARTAPKMP